MAILGRVLTLNHTKVFGIRSFIKDTLLLRPFKLAAEKTLNVITEMNPLGDWPDGCRAITNGAAIMRLKHIVNEIVHEGTPIHKVYSPENLEATIIQASGYLEGRIHLCDGIKWNTVVRKVAGSAEFRSPVTGLKLFSSKASKRRAGELVEGAIQHDRHETFGVLRKSRRPAIHRDFEEGVREL